MCTEDLYRFTSKVNQLNILKNPKGSANGFVNLIINSREASTKDRYAGCIRRWVNYNFDMDMNPCAAPLDMLKAIYWLMDMVDRVPSDGSFRQNYSALFWWYEALGCPVQWKTDPTWDRVKKAVKKQYGKKQDKRLPFTLEMISVWSRMRSVYKGN